jgi:hypothetical protein
VDLVAGPGNKMAWKLRRRVLFEILPDINIPHGSLPSFPQDYLI